VSGIQKVWILTYLHMKQVNDITLTFQHSHNLYKLLWLSAFD